MPQRNLVILLTACAVSYACYVQGAQNPFARYVARGLEEIESGALDRVPNEELFNSALEAMVDVLQKHGDQHSQFFRREEADPFQAEMRQQFGGIGVRIRILGNPRELIVVGAPDPGTPAARADIHANDRVLEIDGKPTAGMNINDVLRLMRGRPGDPLRLLVRHADEAHPEAKQLVREVINVDSILGDRRNSQGGWEFRLEADPRIAQVRVTTFGNKTAAELDRVLTRLTAEGVQAVVLDVRDDAGGSLDAAVAICDMFLPAGQKIVEIRGRDNMLEDRYTSSGHGKFVHLPLAVLVNGGSASASEIVAACLQDNRRAVVLGERSYGKGTVQQLIPIESGRSLLKLTSAKYLRPSGKNIHRLSDAKDTDDWGVTPNPGYEVPVTDREDKAFGEYRSLRDLWGEPPPPELVQAVEPSEPADAAETTPDTAADDSADGANFVDRPLEAAIKYLQGLLANEKSASSALGACMLVAFDPARVNLLPANLSAAGAGAAR
jgi:carboxyl-terminal processing protease